jgi:cellulose synthase/poly-beta-1,6-N-acetylglucosamine synthase-like glycosyltransferase
MSEIGLELELDRLSDNTTPPTLRFGRRAEDQVSVLNLAADFPPGPRVVVVVPAYNEERFIGSVLLKLRQHVGKIIVVDDGSSDATAELAAATGVTVARHACNRGKGAALNTGFRLARALNPQVLVVLDADGQHLPEEPTEPPTPAPTNPVTRTPAVLPTLVETPSQP